MVEIESQITISRWPSTLTSLINEDGFDPLYPVATSINETMIFIIQDSIGKTW